MKPIKLQSGKSEGVKVKLKLVVMFGNSMICLFVCQQPSLFLSDFVSLINSPVEGESTTAINSQRDTVFHSGWIEI